MRLAGFILAVVLSLACGPQHFSDPLAQRAWDSSYVLYRIMRSGSYQVCGTFPVESGSDGTYFVTSGHCIFPGWNHGVGRFGTTSPVPVRVVARGEGDFGLAVLFGAGIEATPVPWSDGPIPGELTYLSGVPHGYYQILVRGYASSTLQDPGFFPVDIASGSGMSGNALWCARQRAVCGVQTGHYRELPLLSLIAPFKPQMEKLEWRGK